MAEKVINGETFKVDVVLATKALELQGRLFKVAGPIGKKLPDLIAGAARGGEDAERANGALFEAVGEIFASIDINDYVNLVRDIVQVAKIRRQSGHFDQVDFDGDFSNKLGTILPVVIFVLKEVLGDFFSGLTGNGKLR